MAASSSKQPVGIVGYRGYSGAELVRYLARHPQVEPVLMEHRDAEDRPVSLTHPGPRKIACSGDAARQESLQAVFLATPHEVSMELAPVMLAAGAKVIDLAAAFRLGTAENYKRWYKEDHTQPELLKEAVYSVPEFHRANAANARLIANPGCYPTAANLALKPLIEAGAIEKSCGVVCDAKSGASGAGRKASLKNSFCEVTENFSAYSILDHRHVPEVLRTSGLEEAEFSFTAHLIPIDRGILETIYFRASSKITSADDILDIYRKRYAGEPFVRLYAPGHVPDLHCVNHTNFCDIGFKFDAATKRTIVVVCEDNLGKGAAGQAIQNMNLMLGFPETAGLL